MNRSSKCAARMFLLGCLFALVGTANAQIDTLRIPPENDFGDLYKRAAESRFVVVGTVPRVEGVSRRMTKDLAEKIKAQGDLSLRLGGTLYPIEVESTLCRQSDFQTRPAASADAPRTVYIFVPRDAPVVENDHQREWLLPGNRYLLFLAGPDQKTLDNWTTTYELDSSRSYFRAQERLRGVVPLKTGDRGVLEKVTRLCAAMRPAGVAQKLAALKKLENSGDDVLEREARAAAEGLQAKKQTE